MKTRTLSTVLVLNLLPALAWASEPPATKPAAPATAKRDNGCEAVLRDTRHPRFAECLTAAYQQSFAKRAP